MLVPGDPVFHLPTAPPRLAPPASIWVPARWRLLTEDHVEELSPHRVEELTEIARRYAVGFPWLLLSRSTISLPAPPEMFLRTLPALDVADDEALAAWCGSWGVPSVPAFLTHEPRSPMIVGGDVIEALPGKDHDSPSDDLGPADPLPGSTGAHPASLSSSGPSLLQLLAGRARSSRAGVTIADVVFRVAGDDLYAVPLSGARFAVGLRQALTNLFLAVPRSPTIEDLAGLDAVALGQIWAPSGLRPVALQRPDPLLGSLVVGLQVLNAMAGDAQAWTVGFTNSDGAPLVEPKRSVGDLLAIELAKFLAEHATVKHCERCGQLFLRQTGRAKAGQYRVTGGVRFCSYQCSQAAQSKAYRDRRASRQRGSGDETTRSSLWGVSVQQL